MKDYGKVAYPASSVNKAKENIDLSFIHESINVNLSCRILDYGLTDRKSLMRFDHFNPPFSRFFIFDKGGAQVKTASGNFILEAGKIYHLPPKQPFEVVYGVSKLIFFHLHFTDIAGRGIFNQTKGIPQISDQQLYLRIKDSFYKQDKLQMFSALVDILGKFLKPLMNSIAQDAFRINNFSQLFAYLDSRPAAGVNVSELAEILGKTPGALSKHFQRKTGMTLKKFLIERQLLQAQELLLHSEKNIVEIAEELGYTNSQYFHRFFKKHCSCTPLEYRKTNEK